MARNKDKAILVTGATGQQGGAVFRYLREKDFSLRVLTRDPDSETARKLMEPDIEVLRGDLSDPATLGSALDDLYGVFSVQNPMQNGGAEQEIQQGKNLADAANRAEVGHFVYSSATAAATNSGVPFFESKRQIEEHVRQTGLPYTILRPASFMENWLGMRDQIEQQGKISLPLRPETHMELIAVSDIGVFAGMAFEKPGAWTGKTVPLAGDDLSMTEIAQAFTNTIGREVRYEQMPWDTFERMAGPAFTQMYRFLDNQTERIDIDALREHHRNLTNFERWLNTVWRPREQAAAS